MKKLIFFLWLFSGISVQAQYNFDDVNKKAQQFFESAEILSRKTQYKESDSLYQLAINASPKFLQAYWFKGNLNLEQIQNYGEAIRCFDKIKEIDRTYQPEVNLKLGLAYMYKQDFENARLAFSNYKNQTGINANQSMEADMFLKSCDYAEQAVKSPIKFSPKNVGNGVNSALDELMPTITADERFIYFTRDEMAGQYLDENIYFSEFSMGNWDEAKMVDRPISTYDYIEGATCISPNGKYLFFTSCGRPDGVGDCDLYFTVKTPEGWDIPKNMGSKVNTPGWDIQPSISPDTRTLYFASRRKGGQGGLDIWKSTLDENFKWSEPVNLGPEINTVKDDERPFIHPDGKTLYFSSDGHPGMGRADFFISRINENGNFSKPQNLGWPLNTPGDEIGICISANGKTGYFASERPDGFGGMDIYAFETDESFRPVYVTYIQGILKDKVTSKPLKGNIKIIDLTEGKIYATLSSDAKTGKYMTTLPVGKDYAFDVSCQDYLFHSENFSLKNVSSTEPYKLDISMQKIEIGHTVVMRNVFFDSDKFELKKESHPELEMLKELLIGNSNLAVEIGGHTDNSGNYKENLLLSEKRAKAVVDYILNSGISSDRITFKGYGDTMPIADNTTEEGKAKNRRTEFKVNRK